MNRKMLMLMMVYVIGNQFSSDSARLLMKLGHGEEALRELFNAKLRKR
jgi:hypothetical protein